MFLQVKQRVNGVVIFHRILEEALPVLDVDPQFLWVGQGGLLKPTRNEDDVGARFHEVLHVVFIDGFNSPQSEE